MDIKNKEKEIIDLWKNYIISLDKELRRSIYHNILILGIIITYLNIIYRNVGITTLTVIYFLIFAYAIFLIVYYRQEKNYIEGLYRSLSKAIINNDILNYKPPIRKFYEIFQTQKKFK